MGAGNWWTSLVVLNIRLSPQLLLDMHRATRGCISYLKCRPPDNVGICHFTVSSKRFHSDAALKRKLRLRLTIDSVFFRP
jgi:hypothetical protein